MIDGTYYTFAEAARELKVTVARVHKLVETYGLITKTVNPRFKLIPKQELSKIPPNKERKRLTGKKMEHRD